jgi:hypothetical protein
MYLELIRLGLNTVICMLIFAAGAELDSDYLQMIAGLMWISKIVASTERKTTWGATKKKRVYREEFPKIGEFRLTDDEITTQLDSGRE